MTRREQDPAERAAIRSLLAAAWLYVTGHLLLLMAGPLVVVEVGRLIRWFVP